MLKISRQQTLERWDDLPISLKESLFSEQNDKILWEICRRYYLPEEKTEITAVIVGDIILGFIHSKDLSHEIQSELGLTPPNAEAIAREIEQKIFAPIRTELEKNYQPPTVAPDGKKTEKEPALVGIPIVKTSPTPPGPPIPVAPKIISEPLKPPTPTIPAVPPAPAIPPTPAVAPTLSAPAAPTPPPAPAPVQPIVPINLDELAKISSQTPKTTAPPTIQPFIIHKETSPEPVFKDVSFPPSSWFKKTEPKKTVETPRAELEMFGDKPATEKKEPELAKTETPKQKVVHYRQAETSTPFGRPAAPFPLAPTPKTETKIDIQAPVRRVEFSKPAMETKEIKTEISKKPPAEKTLDFLQSVVKPLEPTQTPTESPAESIKPIFQKPAPSPAETTVQPSAIINPPEKSGEILETTKIPEKISEPVKTAEKTIKPASAEPEKIPPKPQNQSATAIPSSPASKTKEPIMINLDSFKITNKGKE